jgi:hypothetical protein
MCKNLVANISSWYSGVPGEPHSSSKCRRKNILSPLLILPVFSKFEQNIIQLNEASKTAKFWSAGQAKFQSY